MKLVVGLGNPGVEYERTRHNAGWLVLDALSARHARGAVARSRFHAATVDATIGGEKVVLMKPTTFMNRSGLAVGEAARFFKIDPASDLIVVVDDVALPVGAVRVRASGGTGGHNGLADIDRALGGAPYPRVRVGVGAMPAMMKLADWVLSRFTAEEREAVDAGVAQAADAAECCVARGVTDAMNRFNRKAEGSAGGDETKTTNQRAAPSAGTAPENGA